MTGDHQALGLTPLIPPARGGAGSDPGDGLSDTVSWTWMPRSQWGPWGGGERGGCAGKVWLGRLDLSSYLRKPTCTCVVLPESPNRKHLYPVSWRKDEGPADFSQSSAQCQLPAWSMEPIPFRGLGSPGTQPCAWSAGYPKKSFRDAPLTVHGRDGAGPQPTDRGSVNVCLVDTRGKKSSRQDLRS